MGDYRDTPFGPGVLGFVNTGGSEVGEIETNTDTDIFQTQLISGLTYTLENRGAATGDGSLLDPWLFLMNSGGGFITFDADSGIGENSRIFHTATYTGTHYLGAEEHGLDATGDYTIYVSAGRGTNGVDVVNGTAFGDAVEGLGGNDTLRGFGGNDVLFGGDGNDLLIGGAGDDFLEGGANNDTVRGEAGADVIRGGFQADILIGGLGNDVFQYLTVAGSAPGSRDQIRAGDGASAFQGVGAANGDKFDLSAIDANTTLGGNQTFKFGGTSQTGKGFIWLSNSGGDTILRGNVNNSPAAEFEVEIEDGPLVTAAMYTAADFFL